MDNLVLDACALLTFLNAEDGVEMMEAIFQKAEDGQIAVYVSIINPARLKAFNRISIADAIGLATAKELSAQFVSSDHSELEIMERQESIPFLWLPPHPKK
jgi:predicted nucleic acid-binding protein